MWGWSNLSLLKHYFCLECYRLGELQKGEFTESLYKEVYTRISRLVTELANDNTHLKRQEMFLEWRKKVATIGM